MLEKGNVQVVPQPPEQQKPQPESSQGAQRTVNALGVMMMKAQEGGPGFQSNT